MAKDARVARGGLDLRTKLIVMMLSLLLLSVSALFMLHLYSEQQLLAGIREYTEGLSTAIEIAQEQPGAEGEPQVLLQAYIEKLRKLGVKDVTLADARRAAGRVFDPARLLFVVVGEPEGRAHPARFRVPVQAGAGGEQRQTQRTVQRIFTHRSLPSPRTPAWARTLRNGGAGTDASGSAWSAPAAACSDRTYPEP